MEQQHVVYTGAVLVPFCVGSVALPLSLCRSSSPPPASSSSSVIFPQKAKQRRGGGRRKIKRDENNGRESHNDVVASDAHDYNKGISRCTHLRYCYLRDGAVAAQDLAYRHALYTTNNGEVKLPSSSTEQSEGAPSASQLYALVERVVFNLPNSFPEPHRELTHPPFFVVDDTWAEHMVEMEVHFRPWLGIAPFTVSHMVLLQRRADFVPQFLSSTFGQAKPQPTVILAPSHPALLPSSYSPSIKTTETAAVIGLRNRSKRRLGSSHNEKGSVVVVNDEDENDTDNNNANSADGAEASKEEQGICVSAADLRDIPIVIERRDAIRIFHPTLNVVRYLAAVRLLPQPTLEDPPSFCVLPWHKRSSFSTHPGDGNNFADDSRSLGQKRSRPGDTYGGNYLRAWDGESLPPWVFPCEAIMHAHEPQRVDGAVDAMRAVLAALQKEQAELRGVIEQKMESAVSNAEKLRGVIQRMRETCASLEKSERT